MRRGFTMFEMIIALAVMGILSSVAIPRIAALLDSIHVNGASMELESLFGVARHLAIIRSTSASVDIDPEHQTIAISVGADTLRKHDVAREHGVRMTATRTHMTYAANGIGYGAANLSVVVRRNSAVDTVFVSRLGRVRR